MRVLLGAFGPFPGEPVNPSGAAVARVREAMPGLDWCAAPVLPVRYAEAWPCLLAAIERDRPGLVLLTGLAAGRAGLAIERVALNLDDAEIPDNGGERRHEVPVVAGGPAAYFVTVPVKAMAQAAREAGVPAAVSHSAGTYLCNHVLYRLCHHAAQTGAPQRCGFIHLPLLPQQAAERPGAPGLPLEAMAEGLRAALEAARA